MSDSLKAWLEQIPAFPELLAVYVTHPTRELQARSCSGKVASDGIQSLHHQVRDVLEVLDAGELPARKRRWIFEQAVVYYERQEDGSGMGLVTSHEPWEGDGEIISQLLAAFRRDN
jgi:hypothetical protein